MRINKENIFWILTSILIIVSLHFSIFNIASFPVTIAFILIPFWTQHTFRFNYSQYQKKEFYLILFFFIFPFIPSKITDWNEFYKSYFQFIFSYYFVIRAIYNPPRIHRSTLFRLINSIQVLLLVVVIFQYILTVLLHQHQFYNVWGQFQAYYPLDIVAAKYRMKAFYLEPSYLGLVIINLFWIRLRLTDKGFDRLNFLYTIGMLLLTKSAFAYIAFLSIALIEYHSIIRIWLSRRLRILVYLATIGAFIISLPLILNSLRISEIHNGNAENITSGYMRIVHPINILHELIIKNGHLTGLTFGQLEHFVEKYNRPFGFKETGINNAFFSLIGYWGIFAIALYLIFFYKAIVSKSIMEKSFILLTFFNLNNSGAFIPIQFASIAFLLPILTIHLINNDYIRIKD